MAPDALIGLDFILARLTGVVSKLLVYPENMEKNLNRLHGLIFSQRVMLKLVEKGMKREDAYRAVQRNAMLVWQNDSDFKTLLSNDEIVNKLLTIEELDDLFDITFYLRRIDDIYRKVLG